MVVILPFVSIAHEKANYLRSIFEPNGVKAGGFVGGQSPLGGLAGVDIAICTIEKANSLINRLLEEGRMSELGAVVVDELHMIGDSHRGYLLELLVTKLLYVCRNNRVQYGPVQVGSDSEVVGCWNEVQIIGMSATLPNLDTLAEWLDAVLYCTHFRPVPLQEMVKIGSTLYDTDFKKIRELPSTADSSKTRVVPRGVTLCSYSAPPNSGVRLSLGQYQLLPSSSTLQQPGPLKKRYQPGLQNQRYQPGLQNQRC